MASTTALLACANCDKGEEESVNLKTCVACKDVKYCNRDCQAAHRPRHKKACKKRAAELHEKALFKEVESEECPICMLPLPLDINQIQFQTCCGKSICIGCIYEMEMSEGKDLCAFCRIPPAYSNENEIKRLHKLMDKGNAGAFATLAGCYTFGGHGLPQDHQKANELYLKGGQLGWAEGYYNLGNGYREGRGTEVDMKKAKHYYEVAAMGGCVEARNNLGVLEGEGGNHHRAMKHFAMAAKAGDKYALENIKIGFTHRFVTKDEYEKALHAHHKRQKEMKSDARDKAVVSGMFTSGQR